MVFMISSIDAYRAAKLLIDQYENHAELEASIIADAMLEVGDLDGQRTWMRIREAVIDLQSTIPSGSVH